MRQFYKDIEKHEKEIKKLLQRDMPRIIAIEMKKSIQDNFVKGGFVDSGFEKWKDVERRNPKSKWYGFEYKGEKRTSNAFTRDKKTGKTKKAK